MKTSGCHRHRVSDMLQVPLAPKYAVIQTLDLKGGKYSGDIGGRLVEADTYDEFLEKASEVTDFDV